MKTEERHFADAVEEHFMKVGKARQLYLYSAFHTQWQLSALYIKQTFNSEN